MHYSKSLRVRARTTAALLAMATVLAACAGNPAASGPVDGGSTPPTGMTNGGQLELTVIDQSGVPLDQAEITVLSISGASYRVRGRTNRAGSASFSRVPSQVRVQAHYQQIRQVPEANGIVVTRTFRGNGEEQAEIPREGVASVRMTIEVVAVL